jgi:GDPmannose 4,6-dehydratase
MMLQTQTANDYVIATGVSCSLEQFVKKVFEPYGLDCEKYVQVDKSFFRPLDIHISKADPSKAQKQLGWQAKATLDQVVSKMAAGLLF